jgi:hypothetical protein
MSGVLQKRNHSEIVTQQKAILLNELDVLKIRTQKIKNWPNLSEM